MTVKKRVNLTFFLFFLLSNYCLGSFINLVRTKTEMFYSAFLPKYSLHFASWSHNNTPLIICIFQEHQLITNRQMMNSWRSILTLSLATVVLIIFYNAQKMFSERRLSMTRRSETLSCSSHQHDWCLHRLRIFTLPHLPKHNLFHHLLIEQPQFLTLNHCCYGCMENFIYLVLSNRYVCHLQ